MKKPKPLCRKDKKRKKNLNRRKQISKNTEAKKIPRKRKILWYRNKKKNKRNFQPLKK